MMDLWPAAVYYVYLCSHHDNQVTILLTTARCRGNHAMQDEPVEGRGLLSGISETVD